LIKRIKKRIKKKKRFSKVKNVRSKNYLKIAKVLDRKIYIKKRVIETRVKNVIIKNILAIINSNSRVIKY